MAGIDVAKIPYRGVFKQIGFKTIWEIDLYRYDFKCENKVNKIK